MMDQLVNCRLFLSCQKVMHAEILGNLRGRRNQLLYEAYI